MAQRRQKNRSRTNGTSKARAKNVDTSAFEALGLSPIVLGAVADMGYTEPTPVQLQAIPEILAGRDVMASAQTGTGKTAAFLLPTLDQLDHARHGQGPHMLVVTPTRELAQQIEDVARVICRRTHHVPVVVVGGVGYEPQKDALRSGCDLLVATPGRLIDLINQGACDLSQVQVLVLDEADRMLDMGFLPDMRKIVAETPDDRQTLLFSATLSDDVLDHTRSLVHSPARIEIAHKGTAAETVEQYVLGVSREAKKRLIVDLLRQEGSKRVIVFTNGKHRADAYCKRLRKAGISCAPIHGNRTQNQRMTALRRFEQGEVDVLVATDVLARGIDVADVSYVLNVDVPTEAEDYIHRIGRTGRAGEQGWALTLVTEDDYLYLRDIEKLMGKVIPDFPRAEGLDLGEDPLALDPTRKPTDKLPGKKARKAMERERKAVREKGIERRTRPEARHLATKRPAERDTEQRGNKSGKPKSKGSKARKEIRANRASQEGATTTKVKKGNRTKDTSHRDGAPASKGKDKARGNVDHKGKAHDGRHNKARRRFEDPEPDSVWSNGHMSEQAKREKKHRRHPGDRGGKR